jgi:16S rRNA processing protein RimM
MTRSNRKADHQPVSDQSTSQLSIGQIVGASGLRGEVRLRIWTHFPERIPHLGEVYVEGESAPRRLLGARVQGRIAVLKLEGIETREQAERLRGRVLRIDLAQAAPLAEDEYYHFQVLGLAVVDESGRPLGELVEILETGANDVYIVRGENGEILLPALRSVVLNIDLDRGVMTVRPPQYYGDDKSSSGLG